MTEPPPAASDDPENAPYLKRPQEHVRFVDPLIFLIHLTFFKALEILSLISYMCKDLDFHFSSASSTKLLRF